MKILKITGITVGVLLAVFLVTPLFLSSHIHVERAGEVGASPDRTYHFMADFTQYNKWSPWKDVDADLKFKAEGAGIDSTFTWEGRHSGKGKMTIIGMKLNQLIEVKLNFIKPFASEAMTQWIIEPTSDGARSKITWKFDEDLSYLKRYFGLFADKMLGSDFERGIANIKTLFEAPVKK